MTDTSATTAMGMDDVLAQLVRLYNFSAVMNASEIIELRDAVTAIYAERDALKAENERLRDICSRASAQFCTTIRGCADREMIRELDRAALNTGEQE